MISLVLTIIAFAGAMGIPAFLTAIVESAVRPSSWGTRASRRTSWTDRHRPAEIMIKRTSVGQSLTDGWSVRWTPFRAKDGPYYERQEALTTKEKKSNGTGSRALLTGRSYVPRGLRHRKQREASAIIRRTKKASAIPLR